MVSKRAFQEIDLELFDGVKSVLSEECCGFGRVFRMSGSLMEDDGKSLTCM